MLCSGTRLRNSLPKDAGEFVGRSDPSAHIKKKKKNEKLDSLMRWCYDSSTVASSESKCLLNLTQQRENCCLPPVAGLCIPREWANVGLFDTATMRRSKAEMPVL